MSRGREKSAGEASAVLASKYVQGLDDDDEEEL
jgi:hypothetical protein